MAKKKDLKYFKMNKHIENQIFMLYSFQKRFKKIYIFYKNIFLRLIIQQPLYIKAKGKLVK